MSEVKLTTDARIEKFFASHKDELKGEKGDIGKTAYQSAVDHGFDGTEADWLASLKGKDADAKEAEAAIAAEVVRAKAAEGNLAERIAALKSFDVRVVGVLPITGVPNTVYLVPSAKGAAGNVRDEYLWINGAWEQIGSTSVDLTDYAKKSELPTQYVEDAVKSTDGKTLTLTKNDGTIVSFQGGGGGGTDNYNDLENKPTLNGRTLRGAVVLTADDVGALPTEGGTVSGNIIMYSDSTRLYLQVGAGGYGGSLEVYGGESDPATIKKDGKEVATEEQVNAVSTKVDEIKDTVSIDNRILVDGTSTEFTTAAIQSREAGSEDWPKDPVIRFDKGFDAKSLDANSTETIALDKSVQTVVTNAATLMIKFPAPVSGTVREFVVYIFNTNDEAGPATAIMKDSAEAAQVFQGKGEDWDKECPAGGQIALYITEIPDMGWRAMQSELEVAT